MSRIVNEKGEPFVDDALEDDCDLTVHTERGKKMADKLINADELMKWLGEQIKACDMLRGDFDDGDDEAQGVFISESNAYYKVRNYIRNVSAVDTTACERDAYKRGYKEGFDCAARFNATKKGGNSWLTDL